MQATQLPQSPARSTREIINTAGREHTLVIYYRKLDGSRRRLVGRFDGASSRKPSQAVVWDFEAGGYRTVNLDLVESIKVCGRPVKPALRPAVEREARLQQLHDEMAQLF